MRSFTQLIAALLFFVSFAFAQESVHTYYTTRTVYRVVTETQTGTIVPTLPVSPTNVAPQSSETPSPTGGAPPTESTGAAAALQVPAGIAAAVAMAMFAL